MLTILHRSEVPSVQSESIGKGPANLNELTPRSCAICGSNPAGRLSVRMQMNPAMAKASNPTHGRRLEDDTFAPPFLIRAVFEFTKKISFIYFLPLKKAFASV
jgi:hypothetical protein